MGVDPSHARRRLLVIGAGPAQLGLLRAARARGLFVVACDRDPGALALRYADRHAPVSTEDEEGIERTARRERVAGLVAPGIDWPVAIAARVAARLGLPHPLLPPVAEAAVSKLRQREVFAERGVPQPRSRVLRSADIPTGLDFPCVVKPPDRQGQVAVSLVRERSAFQPALSAALAASRSGAALVEELVAGPEVTVNAFSLAGRFQPVTVTDRLTADPPAFGVALAHAWPSGARMEAAVEAARAAASALEIEEGPTYTQIRLGPAGPRVIELAARLGGGHDAELGKAAVGIDLNALTLAAALGERADAPPARPAGGACVRFLVAREGRLRHIRGLGEARGAPGVVEAFVYREPGWRYGPLRRGADRAGYVLATGGSRESALARAATAAECIRFDVDAEDDG